VRYLALPWEYYGAPAIFDAYWSLVRESFFAGSGVGVLHRVILPRRSARDAVHAEYGGEGRLKLHRQYHSAGHVDTVHVDIYACAARLLERFVAYVPKSLIRENSISVLFDGTVWIRISCLW
jgi:hypothetical protein